MVNRHFFALVQKAKQLGAFVGTFLSSKWVVMRRISISAYERVARLPARVWDSLPFGILLWLSAASLAIKWHFTPPTPGRAVTALAVIAALMSTRTLRAPGKAAWLMLLIIYLRLEFRTIDSDRAKNAQEQAHFFAVQQHGFESVAQQSAANFAQTASRLERTLDVIESNLRLSREIQVESQSSLLNLTGGTSYAFAYPSFIRNDYARYGEVIRGPLSRDFWLKVHNGGKHPLTDVRVTESIAEDMDASGGQMMSEVGYYSVGTLPADTGRVIKDSVHPLTPNARGHYTYHVLITAQNGGVIETIDFRPSQSGEAMAFRCLVKRPVGARNTSLITNARRHSQILVDTGWVEPEHSEEAAPWRGALSALQRSHSKLNRKNR